MGVFWTFGNPCRFTAAPLTGRPLTGSNVLIAAGLDGHPENELMSEGAVYRMQQCVELNVRLVVYGGLLRPFERVANCCVLNPMPKPPRRTSLLLKTAGLHAKPICGPKFFLLV